MWLPVVASLLAIAPPASAHAPIGRRPVMLPPSPRVELRVKFRNEASARGSGPALSFAAGHSSLELDGLTAAWGLEWSPLLRVEPARLEGLRARAEAATGEPATDLQGFFRVELANPSPARLLAVAEALSTLDVVEYVHLAGTGWAPPGDIEPATRDYSGQQDWLGPDPGIDALYAASRGVRGARIGLADCEYDWNAAHEDLVDVDLGRESGQASPSSTDENGFDQHGTAAIGVIVAGDNGYGAVGAAPDVVVTTWPELSVKDGYRRVDAIAGAVADAAPGDVVMLEMQTVERPDGGYGPAELAPEVFELVRTATDAGVIVVAAAGNGAEDLDSEWYQENWLEWGDSGAILVGAGSPDTRHTTLSFSSYGSRVNVQGWGEDVFTLGYGDAYEVGGDLNQAYTRFGGTSSATPLVAAAAVLIQDFVVERGAPPLDAWEMRDLLTSTGVAGRGDPIGPLPDIAAALLSLDRDEDDSLNPENGGDDCDDDDPSVHPGSSAEEFPGFDANCDGVTPQESGEAVACACDNTSPVGALAWGAALAGFGLRRRARSDNAAQLTQQKKF